MEENEPEDGKFAWLVRYDLMEILWSLFKHLSLRRPEYNSGERRPQPVHARPPITGFRIINSGLVLVLGLGKAYLSYGSYGTAATTVDWTGGVVLTTGYSLRLHLESPFTHC